MKRIRERTGFTLIELLIVVAIIAILAAIAVPNFLEAQVRAKVSRCHSDMRSIDVAIESYRVDNNEYPISDNGAPFSVYQLMTTPIAYLSASPRDPFEPMNPRSMQYGWYSQKYGPNTKGPYIYYGPPTYSANNVAIRYNICWTLSSPGPDNIMGWNFDAYAGERGEPIYDPTNGTVSRGNVERVGPGNIPGNFYRDVWNNQLWLQ